MTVIAKPKYAGLLLINGGQHGTVSLHPNQKWEVTDLKGRVSISHGCVELVLDKFQFAARFYIVTEGMK